MTALAKRCALFLATLVFAPGLTAAADAPFNVVEATIADVHAAMKAGRLTCVQLTQIYLDRIAAYDERGPALNAIRVLNPRALEEARALDIARPATGPVAPLHCIPVLLKDNVDTSTMATTNNSAIMKTAMPRKDAFLVDGLRRQGALILGKATMGEFAFNNYGTLDGVIKNPYHPKRSPSGSSGGSAVAVAANFAMVAVGTDTSSSVRGPASLTGIVGIRPTTGLVSRGGIIPKNLEFDTAGPMARTVTDAAILLGAMTGKDAADDLNVKVYGAYPRAAGQPDIDNGIDYRSYLRTGALKGARIGVVRNFFAGDPEVVALAEKAVAAMKAQGAEIIDIQVDPTFVESNITKGGANIRSVADHRFRADFEKYLRGLDASVPKTVAEFKTIYETQVKKTPLPPEDSLMEFLTASLTTSTESAEYKDLVARVLPAATEFKRALFAADRLDALVFPTSTAFAPPINSPSLKLDDPTYVRGANPGSYHIFAGYSSVGNPEIVVPMGFGSQELPMTISIMGKPYDEGRIIGFAYDFEQATKLRAPPRLSETP